MFNISGSGSIEVLSTSAHRDDAAEPDDAPAGGAGGGPVFAPSAPAVVPRPVVHDAGRGSKLVCNACAATFATVAEHREHYKSEWHRHNLKRCVLFVVLLGEKPLRLYLRIAGYLSFGTMAQCVVHALKGLACRARPSRAR